MKIYNTIGFKANPQNQNNTLLPPKKQNEEMSNNTKGLIGLSLVALASIGIYVISKGRHKATPSAQNISEITPKELKRNEIAEKIYKKIDEQLHAKTEINPETIDKNLTPQSKINSWSKKDMLAYYKDLEISSKKEFRELGKIFAEEEAKELERLKIEKAKSDGKNAQWCAKEHDKKEQEYSDWWRKALAEIERPKTEALQKEIKLLETELEKDKQLFISGYKKPLPNLEERFNAVKKYLEIDYGEVFAYKVKEAKEYIANDDNYLEYLWSQTPKVKKISFEINLKNCEANNPEKFYWFNEAMKEMQKRNLLFDKNSLLLTETNILKSIARGKFTNNNEVLGHNIAYSINGALRLGGEVDNALVAILDEGFKNIKPLEEGLIVYRQVVGNSVDKSIDFINQLIKAKKGDTFIDKAYSYTSYYKNRASSCNGISDKNAPCIKLKIILPKGSKVSDGSEYEQREVLLPRNARFKIIEEAKVIKHYTDGDYLEMTVEYVLP